MKEDKELEFEKLLYVYFRDKGIEKDAVISIMLELSHNGNKYEELYNWLSENDKATEEEIFEQLLVIVGKAD